MTLYPGTRLAAESATDRVHCQVMKSWQEGFGDCGVIQNPKVALKEMVASAATKSGFASRFNLHVFHTLDPIDFMKLLEEPSKFLRGSN
ncbi:hypothetical protein RHMOL_Rhmol10G0290400 [Rhododendron molle]|uniref:Uncharacterized protein n=1 Tax=Rhododendron molle TaxID=49168 RepID=A0ACC0M762_RHOML|nr:hypothetical protein RHMOL_Rhmol10G0290400 [Rhododendron molle]